MTETEKSVKLTVAVAILARHNLRGHKDGSWLALFHLVFERLDSQNIGQERVTGIMMLRSVHEQFKRT